MRGLSDRAARRARDDDGSTAIEAVVVVPVLMFLLLAVVQMVLWASAANVVQFAASSGDRAARVVGGSPGLGERQAWDVLNGARAEVASGNVSFVELPGGVDRMTVTATSVSILPGFNLQVSATVVGQVQRFRAS